MKRITSTLILVILLQLAGFFIYGSIQNNKSATPSNSQIVTAVKNDPELLKQLQEAVSNNSEIPSISNSQAAKGDKGDKGDNGQAGPPGNSGTNGANGATGPTGATGATGSQGTNGANGAAGQNGTNASLKLNNLVAPRGATTTITSAQVKSGLMVSIAPSDGTNENRPKVILPSPVTDTSLVGYTLQVVAERGATLKRFGASIGYPGGTPAYLGDFAALAPTDIDFTDNPTTMIYEINGDQKEVTLTQDYSSHPENLIGDIFGQAYTEGLIDFISDYNRPGNNPNFGFAIVTRATGDSASISIIDPGVGDPLGTSGLTATPGFAAYFGYDGAELGVGELNSSNPIGGGFTHTWPDEPYGIEQQTLTLIATPSGWQSTKTPYRSEFINYFPSASYFLTADDKGLKKIIDKFDQEIFDLRARVYTLEHPGP